MVSLVINIFKEVGEHLDFQAENYLVDVCIWVWNPGDNIDLGILNT